MDRSIRVTGKGSISIKPDTTVITLEISSVKDDYSKAIEDSVAKANVLRDIIVGAGLERDELKTTRFNVDMEYESYRDANGNSRSRFIGYNCEQTMRFQYPSDNSFTGNILGQFAACDIRPKFRISFTTSDPIGLRDRVIALAVEDAKSKASALTESAGVKLGKILTIDYSWRTIDIEVSPMNMMSYNGPMSSAPMDLDIEPEDIDASDTVSIVWSIF